MALAHFSVGNPLSPSDHSLVRCVFNDVATNRKGFHVAKKLVSINYDWSVIKLSLSHFKTVDRSTTLATIFGNSVTSFGLSITFRMIQTDAAFHVDVMKSGRQMTS